MNFESSHNWQEGQGYNHRPCQYCNFYPKQRLRCKCSICKTEACKISIGKKFNIQFNLAEPKQHL